MVYNLSISVSCVVSKILTRLKHSPVPGCQRILQNVCQFSVKLYFNQYSTDILILLSIYCKQWMNSLFT